MRHDSAKDSGRFQDSPCFETDGRTPTFRSKTLIDQAMCFSVWGSHLSVNQIHFNERHLDRQAGRSAIGNEPVTIPSRGNPISKKNSFTHCRDMGLILNRFQKFSRSRIWGGPHRSLPSSERRHSQSLHPSLHPCNPSR